MWVPLILVAIVLGIVLLRKYNVKMPAMAVKIPAVSGRVIAWVLGGVALLVAGIWLYSTESLTGFEGLDVNLLIAVGILVALAIGGGLKKVGTPGTIALAVVVGALLLFGADAPKVWKKVQNGAASVVLSESKETLLSKQPQGLPQGRTWESMIVVWDEINPDGTIPMNIPSSMLEPAPGCTIAFSGRNGLDYVVLNRVIGGGWETHKPGQHTMGDKVKFMVIRKGVKEVNYWHSCP